MYKQLIKDKTRFVTSKGELSLEQLFTLSINELDTLAVSLQEAYDKSNNKKSFIEKKTTKDKTLKIQLDVVLDILQDKLEEAEVAKTKAENKARNAKIREIIAEKQDTALANKSINELKSMLTED
jgi:hypothetical protein